MEGEMADVEMAGILCPPKQPCDLPVLKQGVCVDCFDRVIAYVLLNSLVQILVNRETSAQVGCCVRGSVEMHGQDRLRSDGLPSVSLFFLRVCISILIAPVMDGGQRCSQQYTNVFW